MSTTSVLLDRSLRLHWKIAPPRIPSVSNRSVPGVAWRVVAALEVPRVSESIANVVSEASSMVWPLRVMVADVPSAGESVSPRCALSPVLVRVSGFVSERHGNIL